MQEAGEGWSATRDVRWEVRSRWMTSRCRIGSPAGETPSDSDGAVVRAAGCGVTGEVCGGGPR